MKKKSTKPNPQSEADKAFMGSDKHTLDDLKLFPWTPERIIQAQSLGQVYPNTGKQGWEQFRQTGVYPGAIRDTMIFVYLSTLEDHLIEDATWLDAKSFGTKRKLHQDGKEFWQAYALFIKVQREIESAITVPAIEGPPESEADESGNE